MQRTSEIEPGMIVVVEYPPKEFTNNPARKLEGEQFVVKRKRTVTCRKNGSMISRVCYELYGAASDLNVPYGFLADELVVI